jgi:hypothetical protein
MATHAERSLAGKDELPTANFAEREAPFIALGDSELRDRLVSEAIRLQVVVEALQAAGRPIAFSGQEMSPDEVALHGRSEATLHRWDLVGDDDIGQIHLIDPDLTAHAVTVLNTMLPGSRESPEVRAAAAFLIDEPGSCAFASPGQPDVVLAIDNGVARFELASPCCQPTVTADAGTRLLALWGRRSPDRTLTWLADPDVSKRASTFLWPS